MLLILGVLVSIAMLIFICVAAWHRKIGARFAFTLAVVGIMAGVIITNLPNIVGLVLKYGDKNSLELQVQRVEQTAQKVDTQAQQVTTDVAEVRQLKEQIEVLVKRVERSEQDLSKAQGAIEEMRKGSNDTNQKLSSLQRQQAQRSLTEEQQRVLTEKLFPFQGQKVSVACIMDDYEGCNYARNFLPMLTKAGWQFKEGKPGVDQVRYSRDPVGVEIHVQTSSEVPPGAPVLQSVPPAALTLLDALREAGISDKRNIFGNLNVPSGTVEIKIGRKPFS